MEYATTHDYTVLTHDQDFSTLLAFSRKGKPSVVLLRLSSLQVDKVGDHVLKTVMTVAKDIEAGAIVVIEDKRVRVRSLPMRDINHIRLQVEALESNTDGRRETPTRETRLPRAA